ncbi:hypothetical protein GCM10007868_10600 [Gluconobacter frateurii]|uniref:Uncharacterized protein n=1 Tax=Gluconobacter frateurii NRIC 0228 TaxID=1307946 RepID=A0ABQ0QDH6_9PROT|nr:hypothetical protein AA0228_2193 [Gluconobacter frateurii NRIC 0228]GLP89985.1 hypothetical protein GCM10007868_10600 [Gluconobacter frateurii]
MNSDRSMDKLLTVSTNSLEGKSTKTGIPDQDRPEKFIRYLERKYKFRSSHPVRISQKIYLVRFENINR